MDPYKLVDMKVLGEFEYFVQKVNERTEFQFGLRDLYDAPKDDPALGEEVEYFGSNICQDDRLRYIAENIVSLPDSQLSPRNKVCNTIISHFYGARGIHQTITKEDDPMKAHVDFERLLIDEEYRSLLRSNLVDAQANKISIYGTTELRTSIFGAANSFYVEKYNDLENRKHPGNIMEWVANFITIDVVDKILEANTLQEAVMALKSQPGIGQYYGYHSGTSNSVNPNLNFQHDEPFILPGPGCCKTLELMFPNTTKKEFPYDERLIWMKTEQKNLFDNLTFHKFFHNINVNNVKIFDDTQDDFKHYNLEVSTCQYSVYTRLKNNPHLIKRRKIARSDVEKENQSCKVDIKENKDILEF